MDICIFNFKVIPQHLRSQGLNIVHSSWAVSSFSLLSERQVERRGRRDNTQSWINHPSTFDPNGAGGCFCTSCAAPPTPSSLRGPCAPPSVSFIFSSTWQVNLDRLHLPSMTETNILAPRNRALRDRRAADQPLPRARSSGRKKKVERERTGEGNYLENIHKMSFNVQIYSTEALVKMEIGLLWLDVHMLGGPAYLLQCAYAITQAQTHTHAHTHTHKPASPIYIYTRLPFSQPLSHTYSAYAHTWPFIFVSTFRVLQLPAGLWTPVSLCTANPWGAPRLHNTHTNAQQSQVRRIGSLIPALTSLYLLASSTPHSVNTFVPGKFSFFSSVEAPRLCVLAVSRPESGHSFPRQGHRDLALRLHHSACPPGATWPDCSSTPSSHPPPHLPHMHGFA